MIDVVCGVILDETGRYLACQRPDGKHLAGLWEFPGGKIEAGESPEMALARELQEELGVLVKVNHPLSAVIFTYETVKIRLLPFFCEILEGQPIAHEHADLQWLSIEEFPKVPWAEADLPILREIKELHFASS